MEVLSGWGWGGVCCYSYASCRVLIDPPYQISKMLENSYHEMLNLASSSSFFFFPMNFSVYPYFLELNFVCSGYNIALIYCWVFECDETFYSPIIYDPSP